MKLSKILVEIKQMGRMPSKEKVIELFQKLVNHTEYLSVHYQQTQPYNELSYILGEYGTNGKFFKFRLAQMEPREIANLYNDFLKLIKKYNLKIKLDEIKNQANITKQQVIHLIQKLFKNTEDLSELGKEIKQIFYMNDLPDDYGPWDDILNDLNPLQLSILYRELLKLDKNELKEIRQISKSKTPENIMNLLDSIRDKISNKNHQEEDINEYDRILDKHFNNLGWDRAKILASMNPAKLQGLYDDLIRFDKKLSTNLGEIKNIPFIPLEKVIEKLFLNKKHHFQTTLNLMNKFGYNEFRVKYDKEHPWYKVEDDSGTERNKAFMADLQKQGKLQSFYMELSSLIQENTGINTQQVVDLYFQILKEAGYDVRVFKWILRQYKFGEWKRANPSYKGIRDFINYLEQQGQLEKFYKSLLDLDKNSAI